MDEGSTSSTSTLTAIESVDLPEGSSSSQGAPESYFDKVIGILEDIVVGQEFQGLQNYYLSKYWVSFGHKEEVDETEHNTFEHFQIFKDYSQEMSTFLELKLKIIVPSFNIEEFIRQELGPRIELAKESQEDGSAESGNLIDNEIFEMLFTLVDFIKFKELLVDYRKMMEGKTPNLSVGQTTLTTELDDD